MEITYTKQGDYLLPDLTLKETKKGIINKYGRMRLAYLKEYKKALYTSLLMKEELTNHLISVSKSSEDLLNTLMESYKKSDERLFEKNKKRNHIEWAKLMNNYKITAEEIILKNFKEYEHTWRFGLGYGDFPLELQGQFLDILDAPKRIGVCVNSSMMLTPTKSVTCVIGLGHNLKVSSKKNCDFCNFKDKCQFRKQGTTCS